jgi:hypothetical protein
MSVPTSLASYRDCQSLYEKAAKDPAGIRAKLGTYDSCVHMRTRMHYFRKLDRDANAATYPVGHHMHGVSPYDDFVIQINRDEDDEFWLYVTARSAKILTIESLHTGEEIEAEAIEVFAIAAPTNNGLS